MTVIKLSGCRTRPIGSYLKALGILRIVGEQLDSSAMGSWVGDTFHLQCDVDESELVDFFVETYSPTPLVSPWNGGSGFAPKDKAALEAITSLLSSDNERFAEYKKTIRIAQELVADPHWESGGKDAKQRQITACRAAFPDRAVDWLDASVVLANDRAVFPPIFGTGGNDGRLEFSSNFMRRLVELFLAKPRRGTPDAKSLARAALFGDDSALVKGSSGQYDPSSVDPSVTSASGRSESLSNPWDFVLLIEGGLVFASAAARRLGTARGIRAAMPFCVDASTVGSAPLGQGEESRGEIWTPVWRNPTESTEVARLIGEGRAQWGRNQAGNGIDFAKAVASLGVDRGIDQFVRHGILQRYGLTFLVVPLGEVTVGARPQINILQPVDRWLSRLKRELPAAAASARHRVEAAEYRAAADLSVRPAAAFQQVLIELADLELLLSRSANKGEAPFPIGGSGTQLLSDDWLPVIDDGSVEIRIAAALASNRDRYPTGDLGTYFRTASSLAVSLRPIQLNARGGVEWSPLPPRVPGAARRPIHQVLADVLIDRVIRADQRSRVASDGQSLGVDYSYDVGTTVDSNDLLDLAEGRIDLVRVGQLLRGLLLLDWRRPTKDSGVRPRLANPKASGTQRHRNTPAMAALLPFFHGEPIHAVRADDSEVMLELAPRPEWPRLLATARFDDVLDDAVHRLKIAGLRPAVAQVRPTPAEVQGALSIAALCKISNFTAQQFIRQTCPSDSQQRDFANQTPIPTQEEA